MKKLSLLLAFSFVFFLFAAAQDNNEASSNDGKNVFIGAGVQGNVYVNNNASTDIKVWETPSLGGNVFVGKWFSHKIGARLFIEGGSLHPFFQKHQSMDWMVHEKYLAGRVDLMLNLTNLFRSYSPDRFYNLIPYLGVGGAYAFNAVNRPDKIDSYSCPAVGAGLLNTFRLSHNLALYLNLGTNTVDAALDGYKAGNGNDDIPKWWGKPHRFDVLASGAIGLIYNFGKAAKKEVVAPPVVVPEPQPKQYSLALSSNNTSWGTVSGGGTYKEGTNVTAVATALSGYRFVNWTENGKPVSTNRNYTFPLNADRRLVANFEAIPAPPVVEPVKVNLDPVFFRLDKSIIDPAQEIKVQKAAEFLKSNPNAKLNVVGYADVKTGNPRYNMGLSERRTRAVAAQLVKKYGISSDRLILDWKGDTVQPFAINEKNRVVMFAQ